ncbi:MAG TPA: AMP-binding protein [Casimicrobiaceae bacterium]|nr:AMP-binding protein [Casimicrobiaceae bacterium]
MSPSRNLASLLARSAHMWPAKPAIAEGARVLHEYASFADRVAKEAAGMRSAGLAPGDRVALVSRNHPAYLVALFACWWAGLVAVPVNAKLHPKELAWVLDDCGARWVFLDEDWHAALGGLSLATVERAIVLGGREHAALAADDVAVPAPLSGHDPAWLFYTSGTTGRPKGVEITHANLVAMTQCFLSDVEAIAPGDAILHAAPLSHGSGLYAVPHVARAAVNVVPASGGFDAAEIVSLVGAWDRSLFFAAPTMVKRLVGDAALGGARLERLKAIVYGGGPMYVEDAKAAFAALGPRLAQIYGQGESPMTITAMGRELVADAVARGDDARLGSVGVAQSGIEVAIDGPAGQPGEVLVRGATVMRGYWRNAEATARTLAGGWLHTGDLGVLDEHGFLTLKDRSKDLIISGGSNIYPREVEEVLLRHPDVLEVAVIGRRHAEWGEEVVACVVPRHVLPDADARARFEASLDALCLAEIARFKRPKAYAIVVELPKNSAGKVLKTLLRERIASGAAP